MQKHDFTSLNSNSDFTTLALKTFCFQARNNAVYKKYLQLINVTPNKINNIKNIPFLPITFFKTHKIKSFKTKEDIVFTSSGTTGNETSKHYVKDLEIYKKSFESAFKLFYGNISDYCILALLPSYLERNGSSLIYMVNELIKQSENNLSGFYINNFDELNNKLKILSKNKQKTILLGVSFALMDFSEKYPQKLPNNFIVMETGGMKGRRKEIIRSELHKTLCNNFGVKLIHSEYGMTELLSQAYSKGNGIYYCPPWIKVIIRDTYDPFSYLPNGKTGGINVIDLANQYSCSFIETQDLGKTYNDGSFEVIGRIENSQIRGCNLLISDYK
ncbi:MAG: acyl transferase [Bacteroidetes bacterium CG_4_8_14_3_um_filter_31_14]|nr:MAG: acyl transferase [Bacteroidetes bacterium CG_4_8_14_3_um_filter_31_14]